MANRRKEPDTRLYSGKFAVRLRELREKAGLTIEDVAWATYIPKKTLYNWEGGISQPPIDALPLLAEAYRVSVRSLFPKE